MKTNQTNATATKLFPSGAIEVRAIIGEQLIRRVYFGYSKREALAMFKEQFNQGKEVQA